MEESANIPNWGLSGLLPPFLESAMDGSGQSPYQVGLAEVTLRLGTSVHRRKLLNGLLDFRARLHAAGIRKGFQWVNGSFVEDTSRTDREPSDIDIVTFMQLPSGQSQSQLYEGSPEIFDWEVIKDTYGVDAYTVVLDAAELFALPRTIAFWSGLWSHDRVGVRKGYLEIDLSGNEDASARTHLKNADDGGTEG